MKFFSLATLLLLAACSSPNASESKNNEKNDYYIILSSLLGVNDNRFSYVDNDGNSHPDRLRLFKELEEVYGRYIEPPENDGTYGLEQVKIIMLFAFYSENRNSGAFSEYLASDLKPIYSKNRLMFLKAMNELPFLVSPTCNRLNAFFGFEGKNLSKKEGFIKDNKAYFETHLTKVQMDLCLNQFSK